MSKASEIRAENERLKAALRKIHDDVRAVEPGNEGSAYYGLGRIRATAAIALGEAIWPGEPAPSLGAGEESKR